MSSRSGARWFAALSVLLWAGLFYGLIDLLVPLDETPGFYDSYLLETGWGVLYTFLLGAAFVALALRPRLAMPLAQIGLVALALAITAAAAGSWMQLLPAVLLGLSCFVLWKLAHGQSLLASLRGRLTVDYWVGLLAIALVGPAAIFALEMITSFREGRLPRDDTNGIDHWPTQAALALALSLVAMAIALGVRSRWTGTTVSGGCVVVAAGWFGYWSAVYPDHAGSAGGLGGTALIVWAVAFGGVLTWRLRACRSARRRDRERSQRPVEGRG